MRFLFFLFCICGTQWASAQVSLVHLRYKAPPVEGAFSLSLLAQDRFPIHTADLRRLGDQAIVLAKTIDQQRIEGEAFHTLRSGRSTLSLRNWQVGGRWVLTITLATDMGSQTVYYDLVTGAHDARQVQRQLVHFASYINGEK